MKDFDPALVALALRDAAKEAVLPRFRALADHQVHEKAPGDLVTIADIEAERFLTRRLTEILPGSTAVGEEAFSRDSGIVERLHGDEPVWLIDPVDGTRNFAHGKETFCMMVALLHGGETVRGWIYDPLTDRLFMAEKGAGAAVDDRKLTVSPVGDFSTMVGQVRLNGFAEADRPAIKKRSDGAFRSLSNLRCAGHDFLAQALGERHFALYNRIWMWDHAPGVLILREAGGHVARIDDIPYRPADRVDNLLSAPNRAVWDELKAFFVDKSNT